MPRIQVEKDRCKGCELCVSACPQNILAMTKELNAKGYFFVSVAEQARCICPDVALQMMINGTMYKYFTY
jgi:2-oxoglutarate ferredoxin oxidoreductase subunit delta